MLFEAKTPFPAASHAFAAFAIAVLSEFEKLVLTLNEYGGLLYPPDTFMLYAKALTDKASNITTESIKAKKVLGIGLYLAREIIGAEGGYIKVSSVPGKGSVFSVFLPKP